RTMIGHRAAPIRAPHWNTGHTPGTFAAAPMLRASCPPGCEDRFVLEQEQRVRLSAGNPIFDKPSLKRPGRVIFETLLLDHFSDPVPKARARSCRTDMLISRQPHHRFTGGADGLGNVIESG